MNVAALCFANVAAPRRGHSFGRELRNSFALALTALALVLGTLFSALVPEFTNGAAIGHIVAAIGLLQWAVLGALLGNRYKGSPTGAEDALRKGRCITISIFG